MFNVPPWEISEVGYIVLVWTMDKHRFEDREGTTDRRVRSHPPQCTTSHENREIVRMAVTDRSVTSRTVAQHIQSVTHYPVSARTIRRRLQQSRLSATRPFLRLPLSQNHKRLRRQWCDERRMWMAEWNEIVFTDEQRFCLQHHDGRIRVWRHREERMLTSCVMHRHTGPAPGIMRIYASLASNTHFLVFQEAIGTKNLFGRNGTPYSTPKSANSAKRVR
ncbi:hypothetical protein LAZ67_5002229 [Cordylochernes scorpioides]|uniref:Transposase Tc1-like domain-containing protein n=1 Tax=Cordylochernes scorpioides TaxID=51811 RepID=A0ABY6KGI0_9ARAC|nr:hypothetical protein LAZ67_5002229 [Cordylochernes scorpioides]